MKYIKSIELVFDIRLCLLRRIVPILINDSTSFILAGFGFNLVILKGKK